MIKQLRYPLGVIALFMVLASFLTSCQEDENLSNDEQVASEFQNIIQNNSNTDNDSLDLDEVLCFELVFPIQFQLHDGNIVSMNSLQEIEDFFEQNEDDPDFCPEVVFPVSAVLEDGTTVSITNEDELEELFDSCGDWDDDYEDEFCFEVQFPVTIQYPDGTTVDVNSFDELDELYEAYFEANPDAEDCPEVVYPVNVVYEDGTVVTITDEDMEMELVMECYDELGYDDWDDDDYELCFDFVFPLNIQDPDSTIHTFNSLEEIEDHLDAWFEANPTLDDTPELLYPYQVTLEDGTMVTVNNEEDEEALWTDCIADDGGRIAISSSGIIQHLHQQMNRIDRIRISWQTK